MIRLSPDERDLAPAAGQSLLDVCLSAGVPLTHACGGKAKCSTCRVLVAEGLEHASPRTAAEERIAGRLQFSPSIRLGCQVSFRGPARVRRLVLDDEDRSIASEEAAALELSPAGEDRLAAILFADIRGFTPFAESLSPYDVIHVLNRYHRIVGQAIGGHGGTVDNYMGDGVLAVFGLDGAGDAALRAVRAGLDLVVRVRETLAPHLVSVYGRPFRIGVGIHFGTVVRGSVGFAPHRRTTIISDAVNFASRVEKANKEGGTELLVSQAAWKQVESMARVGRILEVELAGKDGRHLLYEIVGLEGSPSR